LIIGVPVATVAFVVIASLRQLEHTAESKFVLESQEASMSGLAALAGQFGVNVGNAGTGSESIGFYARLLSSREVLSGIATAEYRIPAPTEGAEDAVGSFIDLDGITGDSDAERVLQAVEQLERKTMVRTDLEAGMITVAVTMPSPELAEQIARRLLDEVQAFDLHKRQSRARAEREFVGRRLSAAEKDLEAAEAALELFLEENRRIDDSPRLVFERGRLQRHIDLRQQVHSTLAQSYEQARIDEVRNTPVITIVDAPEGSARPSGSILVNALLGLMLGTVLGLGWMMLREHLAQQRRQHPAEYEEFDLLCGQRARAVTQWLPKIGKSSHTT
jgi:uncharacterized protein involved in exopolysaccharide biosynthesis